MPVSRGGRLAGSKTTWYPPRVMSLAPRLTQAGLLAALLSLVAVSCGSDLVDLLPPSAAERGGGAAGDDGNGGVESAGTSSGARGGEGGSSPHQGGLGGTAQSGSSMGGGGGCFGFACPSAGQSNGGGSLGNPNCNGGTCVQCSNDSQCPAGLKCKDGECTTACNLEPVYFDFNEYAIRLDQENQVSKNASCLKESSQASVQVEGHCDERGSDEYNLALGERRSRSVSSQYKALGVKNPRCFNQEVGNQALTLRCNGFFEGLGVDGADKILTGQISDPAGMQATIAAALQTDPTIDGILTLGPSVAKPALEAVAASGKTVHLATFDLSADVLTAIKDGKMDFAIDQQQFLQGYLPIQLLRLYNLYGVMPAGTVMTGPGFVTKENAAQVIKLSAEGIR